MALSPSRVYRVETEYIVPSSDARFGRTLFVTISAKSAIDKNNFFPVRGPRSVKEINSSLLGKSIFPRDESENVYLAVNAFFRQQLNNSLLVGRWNNNTEVKAKFFGEGDINQDGTAIAAAVTAGAARILFMGRIINVAIALTDNTYAKIATALTSGLNAHADISGVAVVITSSGANINELGILTDDNAFTALEGAANSPEDRGAKLLTQLGLDKGVSTGWTPAETIDTYLERLISENIEYDFVTVQYFDGYTAVQIKAVRDGLAAFARNNTQKVIIEFDETDKTGMIDIFSLGDVSSPGAVYARDNEVEGLICIGDKRKTRDYKSVRLASAYAGVDYYGEDTYLNAHLLIMGGSRPTELTEIEADALDVKRFNYFTKYVSAGDFFAKGVTLKPNAYIDSSITLQFTAGALSAAMWGIRRRYSNLAGISGVNKVHDAIIPVLEALRTNGSIVAGVLHRDSISEYRTATRNPSFEGEAPAGYLFFTDSLSARGPQDIKDRIMPDTIIWLNLVDPYHQATLRVIGREGGTQIITEVTEEEA